MPRFNRRGAVTPQLGYSWFDQERFIFQDCSTGVCRIVLSDGTLVKNLATNDVRGGGAGQWAAWVALDGVPGVLDGDGRWFPRAGMGPMGPDGAYALKVLRNSYGPWDVIERDGSRWRLTDGDAADIQLLGNRRALWTEGGIVKATFAIVAPDGPVWWPRVAEDGALLYQRQLDGALVLAGRVIAPPSPKYFYPDIIAVGDGYRVTWSPSQADTDAQFLDVTRAQLAALPIAVATTPSVPVPVPVPQPTPEPIPTMAVQNRATELTAFHLWWNGSQLLTSDAEKHPFTEALAVKFNALDGSGRWGRKARVGTDAKSKDTLGYWLGPMVPHNPTDGKVDAFDVIASTGAVSWDLRAEQNDPGYRSIDARWFPVSAASVPNPGPIVPIPGPTPQQPPIDLSAVLAKMDALTALLMDLRTAVETTALDVETIHARVMQAPTVTFPKYSGRIGGTGRFSTAIDLEPVKQ